MKTKIEIKLGDVKKIKKFIKLVDTFKSDIDLSRGRYVIDAKSTIGIFTLDLSIPVNVEIHSDDQEEVKRFNEVMYEFI